MTDDPDPGHLHEGETAATPAVDPPATMPNRLVFGEVASLADSLVTPTTGRPSDRSQATSASPPTRAPDGDPPPASVPDSFSAPAPVEVVTDEERTRYGRLLDSAAERGLLDPAEYEIRLRELAEATTTAQMLEIVTELPAFTPRAATTVGSRRSIRPSSRATATDPGGHRRRTGLWVVLAVVVLAVAALIALALSVDRLSHTRNSSLSPSPVATRTVSGPHP